MNEHDESAVKYAMKCILYITYVICVAQVTCYFNNPKFLWLLIVLLFV